MTSYTYGENIQLQECAFMLYTCAINIVLSFFFREELRCPAPLARKMPPVFTRGWDWTYWPRSLLLPGSLRRSPFYLSLTLCNIHCVFYSISKCFGQVPIFVLSFLRSLIFGTENDDSISM